MAETTGNVPRWISCPHSAREAIHMKKLVMFAAILGVGFALVDYLTKVGEQGMAAAQAGYAHSIDARIESALDEPK